MKIIKTIAVIWISILFHLSGYCQNVSNINNHWIFGNSNHLDFVTDPPTTSVLPILLDNNEQSSAIADGMGNLLFYLGTPASNTTQINVYDANNNIMPNGSGIMGDYSSTMGALIIQMPGDCDKYYIFHTSISGHIRYSVVDMTANSGNGDVIVAQKNILIYANGSEKMLAAQKGISQDYWIVTRNNNSGTSNADIFLAFEVTSAGVNTAPVVSTFSNFQGAGNNANGWMCFNDDYTKIADASNANCEFNTYNFNSLTGIVSGKTTIYQPSLSPSMPTFNFGACWTGGVLYFTFFDAVTANMILRRYDIATSPSGAIFSDINTGVGAGLSSLQKKNTKMYMNNTNTNFLHVVNDPEIYSTPNFVNSGLALSDMTKNGIANYFFYYDAKLFENLGVMTPGNSQQICYNTSTILGGNADSADANYFWQGQIDIGGGWLPLSPTYLVNPNVTNPTTINLTSAITRFVLTLLSPCGDTIYSDKEFVYVDYLSTPSITGNINYCAGDTITSLASTPPYSGSGIINWYSDSALTSLVGTGINFTPPNTPGATTYYVVEQENTSVAPQICTSLITPVTVTISPGIALCFTKRAAKWYFGDSLGLNFLCSSPPSILSDGVSMSTPFGSDMEAGTTIADVNGNLLFYAHDSKVRNRNHVIMPNGNGMASNGSASQGYLPVPNPINPNKYYLFHVLEGNGGLFYSEIDLLADAGNGDVIAATKNTLLLANVGEQLTAVESCVANETWIIVHNLNNLYTFKVTGAGISGPIVSPSPVPMTGASGQMMVSPTGRHIALTFNNYSPCYLFQFDNETGKACYKETLANGGYGCSFSNNGQYLYTNEFFIGMFQYDVFAPNVNASSIMIYDPWVGGTFIYGSMHLGPDCKLYTFGQGNLVGSVINNPNNPGLTCNLQVASFPLSYSSPLQSANFSATNYIQSWFKDPTYVEPIIAANFNFNTACLPTATTFTNTSTSISDCPVYSWNFADVGSGASNTSSLTNPTHIFSSPGTYNVSLTITERCQTSTQIIPITVYGLPVVDIIADTTVCENFGVTLNTTAVGDYLWTGPSGNMSGVFTSTLQNPTNPVFLLNGFANEGWYYLTVTNAGGCSATDSIYIHILAVPFPNITSSIVNCIQTLTGSIGSSNGPIISYAWGPTGGSSLGTTISINLPASYPGPQVVFFVTDSQGCGAGAIINTTPLVQPNVTAGAPLILSCGTPSGIITASSTTPGATYSWAGAGLTAGGTTSSATVNLAGIYTVTVTNPSNGCNVNTTVNVTASSTLPTTPIIYTPNSWYCVGDNTTPLNSSSGDLWYSNPGLTTMVGTGLNFSPPTITGIATYYVVDTLGACVSSADSVTVEFTNCAAHLCSTNLLSNGGFDNYSNCPTNMQQVANATSWLGNGDYYNTICNGFYNSPSYFPYFNAANYLMGLSGGGVFPPPNGAGSAGIILGGTVFKNFVVQQVDLGCSKEYTLQFRATTPRSDTPPDNSLCVYGSNTPPPYSGCDANLTLLACLNSPGAINNFWTPQTITFTPVANYSYMILTGQCPTATSHGGTVFLDDLFLCGTCVNPPIVNSTTQLAPATCNGADGSGTANVSGCDASYTYDWQNVTSLGTTVSALNTPINFTAGTYSVIVTDGNGCTANNTLVIASIAAPLTVTSSSNNNITCTNLTATLTGVSAGNTMVWNGGTLINAANPATVIAAGTYTVTATDNTTGCTGTSQIIVTSNITIPDVTSGPPQNINCLTGLATINANSTTAAVIYSWTGAGVLSGGNTSTPTVNSPGTYTVTLTDPTNGCIATSSLIVGLNPPPSASAGADVTITSGTNTILISTGGGTYLWNTGQTDSSITVSPTVTTDYCVTVTDVNGCKDVSCVRVNIDIECGEFFVPTGFSPNGDGSNDELCIYFNELCVSSFNIQLFDRWGELVYESNDIKFCWDGNYKGKALDNAVFAYKVKATTITNETIDKKGNTSLFK